MQKALKYHFPLGNTYAKKMFSTRAFKHIRWDMLKAQKLGGKKGPFWLEYVLFASKKIEVFTPFKLIVREDMSHFYLDPRI